MAAPSDRRIFLSVKSSISEKTWVDRLDDPTQRNASAIAQKLGLSEILSRIVAARIDDPESAAQFLDPTVRTSMPDPSVLQDAEKAAERIAKAIKDQEQIAIFGDYDVDGATSSALVHVYLRELGLKAPIYIPDRIFEGYGPNEGALDELRANGADLLICVDCGMTSFGPLQHAAEIGLDVVVIDHHQPGDALPEAVAVVNPNRDDDISGLGTLCAAGVAFMVIVALNRKLRDSGSDHVSPRRLMDWMPLVALGTVCDVVPLAGLNRAMTRTGLAVMARRDLVGLTALSDAARLNGPPSPYHLGFLLGPRINAGGRIGQSDLGAKLLTTNDPEVARSIAQQLDELNKERQVIESKMLESAMAETELAIGSGPPPPVIISAHDDWHPGVIGLVASRLKERFGRPALAIALDEEKGTGSARSILGVDIGAAVRAGVASGLLEKGGGHAMAAGFTVARDKLANVRASFEEALSESVDASRQNELVVDAALTAGGATPEAVADIERAGPFGAGNPDPTFVFPSHNIRKASQVGAGHIRCSLIDGGGRSLQSICFRAVGTPLGDALLSAKTPLHVAGSLRIDHWGGGRRVQCHIRDLAKPDA